MTSGAVERVIDGDTVELDSGERIRYLMVDAPELSTADCFAEEARRFNEDLVLGERVELAYDVECEDRFGRLLAFVTVQGREVNSLLVERGFACVLVIPPNGADRAAEFEDLEDVARLQGRGMWGSCQEVACD